MEIHQIIVDPVRSGDACYCEGCDGDDEGTPAEIVIAVGPIFCRSSLALCAHCLRRLRGRVDEAIALVDRRKAG